MKIKFLLDETLSPRLKVAVLRLNPEIDILRIGEPNTPPLGTLDPDVLQINKSGDCFGYVPQQQWEN